MVVLLRPGSPLKDERRPAGVTGTAAPAANASSVGRQLPARVPAEHRSIEPTEADALPAELTPELLADIEDAAELVRGRRAKATIRAYDADLRALQAYLRDRGQPAELPVSPLLVAAFVSAESRPDERPGHERPARAVSTIERRLAAIGKAHQLAGVEDPTKDQRVRDALTGARRRLRTAPTREKAALALEDLEQMVRRIARDTHAGRRDRALLLTGIAGAFRRSELVALDAEDVRFVPEGMLVSIRRSKTDQEGSGHVVAVPRGSKLRPVEAVDAWLEALARSSGPLFVRVGKGGRLGDRLTDQSVALIVKKWAAAARLDPAAFSGHSLRAGFVTSALEAGADLLRVMDVTRHREIGTLKAYDRRAQAFRNHAGRAFL